MVPKAKHHASSPRKDENSPQDRLRNSKTPTTYTKIKTKEKKPKKPEGKKKAETTDSIIFL